MMETLSALFVGIIGLAIAIFVVPYIFLSIGKVMEFFSKKDDGLSCSCIGIILTLLITIIAFVGQLKSCASNDRGPSPDYYDAPRK